MATNIEAEMKRLEALLAEARSAKAKALQDVEKASQAVKASEKVAKQAVKAQEKAAKKVEESGPGMNSEEFREKFQEAAKAADASREEEELRTAKGDEAAASQHPDSLAKRTEKAFQTAAGATSGFYALIGLPPSHGGGEPVFQCGSKIEVTFRLGKRAAVVTGPQLPFASTQGMSADDVFACCLSSEFPCKNDFLGVFASEEINSITGHFDLAFSDVSKADFQRALGAGEVSGKAQLSLPGPSFTGRPFNVRFVTHSGVVAGVSQTFRIVEKLPSPPAAASPAGSSFDAAAPTIAAGFPAETSKNPEELELHICEVAGIDNGVRYDDGGRRLAANVGSNSNEKDDEAAKNIEPAPKPQALVSSLLSPSPPLLSLSFSYSVELLSQIGVYSLLIPLPDGFRVASASPGAPNPRDNFSPTSSTSICELPKDWRPGLAVKDGFGDEDDEAADIFQQQGPADTGDASASSATKSFGSRPVSIIELSFELPVLPPSSLPPAAIPPAEAKRLPRQLFKLRYGFPQRLESAEASFSVHTDHIAVRAPLFYRGAMTLRNDKPLSSISQRELYCLKQPPLNAALSCRFCRGPLLSSPAASSALRAEVLPSEYWLDLSDFWLCHGDEKNVLIPSADFGAIEGLVLVGESSLQLHPRDVNGEVLLVSLPAMAVTDHGQQSHHHRHREELTTCDLKCKRCRSKLGQIKLASDVLTAASAAAQSYADASATLASLLPALSASSSVSSLPSRLAKDSDPYPLLFKDALWLPEAVPTSAGKSAVLTSKTKGKRGKEDAAASTNDVAAIVAGGASAFDNALRTYTPATRVSERILSSILAHGQYSFLLQSPSAVAVRGEVKRVSAIALLVTAWNGKIAQNARPCSLSEGRPAEAFVHLQPVPALRVQYRLLETAKEAFSAVAGAGETSQFDTADAAPDLLLEPAVLEGIADALMASTDALPASKRRLGDSDSRLGFLPLSLVR